MSTATSPGPMVRRQPFGGWKASNVGPGAKAGGPNYVLQLARWTQRSAARRGRRISRPRSRSCCRGASAETTAGGAAPLSRRRRGLHRGRGGTHFAYRARPESACSASDNGFRYRPCGGVAVRVDPAERRQTSLAALARSLIATALCGTPVLAEPAGPSGVGRGFRSFRASRSSKSRRRRSSERLATGAPARERLRVLAGRRRPRGERGGEQPPHVTRDRRAGRSRTGLPGAPLVPPRAGDLPRAAPVREHHVGARRDDAAADPRRRQRPDGQGRPPASLLTRPPRRWWAAHGREAMSGSAKSG